MNILFLGYAVDSITASKLSGASVAGNKMQLNVLRELSKYEDIHLNAITVYPVAAYPKDKIYIAKKEIPIVDDVTGKRVAFLNLPLVKQAWQTLSVYFQAKRFVKTDKNTIVLSFNLYPQIGLPLKWLKEKHHVPTVSLLADLPIDDNYSRKGLSVYFRKLFDNLTLKAIAVCDRLIVLNENAIKQYAPGKEHIVMEGGIDLKEVGAHNSIKSGLKNIVYSGALTEYSGIRNLIGAMKYVKDDAIILQIYGSGLLSEEIIKNNDKNVQYMGSVTNDEMRRIQSGAWLLANPRPVDDPIAQVTFPSKIFEYMVSGTPVLTTRLNGFTEEYKDKLFFTVGDNAKAIAQKINEITAMPPEMLHEKAAAAKDFIVQNKTWEIQGLKIYKFLHKAVNE